MGLAKPMQPRRSGREAPSKPRLGRHSRQRRVSLCETLDRVLNKGAVIAGDIVISVAGVELVYVQLSLLVSSVETMRQWSQSNQALARSKGAAISATPSRMEA